MPTRKYGRDATVRFFATRMSPPEASGLAFRGLTVSVVNRLQHRTVYPNSYLCDTRFVCNMFKKGTRVFNNVEKLIEPLWSETEINTKTL